MYRLVTSIVVAIAPSLWAASPKVYYSFDNYSVSGNVLSDLSGYGNNGTIVNARGGLKTSQQGLMSHAFGFSAADKTDGTVRVPAAAVPSGATARTFSVWFNQTQENGQDKLFGYGNSLAGGAFDVGLDGGGIRIRHYGGNITYGSGLYFNSTHAGWNHVAVRVNNKATTFQNVDVFLNGLKLPVTAQESAGTSQTINTGAGPLALGNTASPAYANSDYIGRLDEFKLYSGAITDAEILALAQRPANLAVPRITSFESTRYGRVPAGTRVRLSWAASGFQSLGLNPGNIDVSGLNSVEVSVNAKTTYTLTAVNASGMSERRTITLSTGPKQFPNIVVFLLDDFGWSDWNHNGASTGSTFYETPHFNQLAAEGMWLPHGYACTPVCTPTRASVLTGQSPARNHLSDWIPGLGSTNRPLLEAVWTPRLDPVIPVYPRVLRDNGYRTIHVGKWHLGEAGDTASNPLNFGYDVNIGGNQAGAPPSPEQYFAGATGFAKLPNLNSAAVAPQGSYLTDVLTKEALKQIRSSAADGAPFLLNFCHYAVHTPIQAPAATVAKYQAKKAANPSETWNGQNNATYAAMIEHVDRSLGAVLDALDNPDGNPATNDSIAENTLVVLFSDNGGLNSSTSNFPLRGGKGQNYEGGIREPLIFRWKGKIAPGGVSNKPAISHDIFPTLLSVAGISKPAPHIIDGQNLSPLLFGTGAFNRISPIVFHYPHWSPQNGSPYSAIRYGDFKLIYNYQNTSWELYNVVNDIGETNNLVASDTDRRDTLSWDLVSQLEACGANYPRSISPIVELPPIPFVSPLMDSDGDGSDDYLEVLSGNDPDDPVSVLSSTQIDTNSPAESGETGSELTIEGKAGRTYILETSLDEKSETWSEIYTVGPLEEDAVIRFPLPLDSHEVQRFYRWKVDLP